MASFGYSCSRTRLSRSVNARRQQALTYAEATKPGRCGVCTPAQQKLLFVEGAELLVFLPKMRFREALSTEFYNFRQKTISVFDRKASSCLRVSLHIRPQCALWQTRKVRTATAFASAAWIVKARSQHRCRQPPAATRCHLAELRVVSEPPGEQQSFNDLVSELFKNCTEVWFRHGCSGNRNHQKTERNYGFGIDALVIAVIRKRNGIMVWAWMLW